MICSTFELVNINHVFLAFNQEGSAIPLLLTARNTFDSDSTSETSRLRVAF